MAQTCEMKLLGAPGSVFVTRVKFALKLKCIEYEYIEEDLRNKSELLRTSSPIIQQVPVLFHANEQPMIESLAILEYLDEIQPYVHPLLPSNPSDRAQCRNLAYTFDTQYHPLTKEFLITREGERREELKRLIIERYVMLEEAFVKLSKGKPFFGGDDIGYLDIVLGSFLGWFKLNGTVFGLNMIDEARTPKLTEWVRRMWSHEVTKSMIPSHEIHMKFLNMLQA
ncbi:glutathione S-transferase U16-like isoform X3 [Bidens hawaiensis]|uniref:glutathione S-transferase U16-like isoform X3 n=1 Tax=Bidens hawaiensis TaxID=980011 RepID=UPI00404973C8